MDCSLRTNLLVNYLPTHYKERDLRMLFEIVGPVSTVKIVRRSSTRTSYGYGFVDFVNPTDASKAFIALNGFQVQHKRIKISYARPDGDLIRRATIYISGIPKYWNEPRLISLASQCGEVIAVRLLKDARSGGRRNRGFGFILYAQRTQAMEAIELLNGIVLDENAGPISVEFAKDCIKKHEMVESTPADGNRDQACGGHQPILGDPFPPNPMLGKSYGLAAAMCAAPDHVNRGLATESQPIPKLGKSYGLAAPMCAVPDHVNRGLASESQPISKLGMPYGHAAPLHGEPDPVNRGVPGRVRQSIPRDAFGPLPNPMKGMSSCRHETPMHAVPDHGNRGQASGMRQLIGRDAFGSFPCSMHGILSFGPDAEPVVPDAVNYTIFVYNLGPNTHEPELNELFSVHGAVERVKIVRECSTGKSRRFGYVTMTNYREALTAIRHLDGLECFGNILYVSFKIPE